MKNPVKEYRRLKRIVDYYEANMQHMIRCRKYAELGQLLLCNVRKGDVIYLIASGTRYLDSVRTCIVELVEFVGHNDARIVARDISDPDEPSNYKDRYIVHNRRYGRYFFTDPDAARAALRERRKSWR